MGIDGFICNLDNRVSPPNEPSLSRDWALRHGPLYYVWNDFTRGWDCSRQSRDPVVVAGNPCARKVDQALRDSLRHDDPYGEAVFLDLQGNGADGIERPAPGDRRDIDHAGFLGWAFGQAVVAVRCFGGGSSACGFRLAMPADAIGWRGCGNPAPGEPGRQSPMEAGE